MKNILLIMLMAACLCSCNSDEKNAAKLLSRAEHSFGNGNYNCAKLQIDSIKTVYPKAFAARKAGIRLMQQIDLKEQTKTLVYLDSMLQIKQQALDAIKKNYVFEKDEEYQEIGNYFYPSQTVEKNIGRSFLRAQVNELGEMYLTSIYTGAGPLNHHSVKVSVGDSYAQTPVSTDRYETKDLGKVIEKSDYKAANDGGVTGFIMTHQGQKIRLQYEGKRSYKTYMSASDVKAVAEIAQLARILASMQEIRKEQQEANLKIRFVKRKMQEAEAAAQNEE